MVHGRSGGPRRDRGDGLGRRTERRRLCRIERLEERTLLNGTPEIGSGFECPATFGSAFESALDPTFGGGLVTTDMSLWNDYGRAVAVQSDGKIVLAGQALTGWRYDFALARYNSDGSLDPSFAGDGTLTTSIGSVCDLACSVAIQPDGKILAAGWATMGSYFDFALVRYNADGTLDPTFSGDGMVTTSLGAYDDRAERIAIQSDGKIIVAGESYNGADWDFAVVRYNTDGSLDTAFSGDGKLTTAIGPGNDEVRGVALQNDGKIVVAGNSHNGTDYDIAVVRYRANGTLDTSFSGDGKLTTAINGFDDYGNAVALQADGKIVVGGNTTTGSTMEFAAVRYRSDGSLDTSFDGDGIVTTLVGLGNGGLALAVQPDGKIVLSGDEWTSTGADFALVRYNSSGSLDTSFGSGGSVTTSLSEGDDFLYAMALQADGKIVTAGTATVDGHTQPAVARHTATGSMDNTFSGDGRLVMPWGAGDDVAYAMALQSDGKVVLAGVACVDGAFHFALSRYNADGSPDSGFGNRGRVITAVTSYADYAYGVAVQSDGKIVAAGFAWTGSNFQFAVVRYNTDGSLDTGFDADGIVLTSIGSGNALGYGIAIQTDGRIVVAGNAVVGSTTDFALARYNPNGSLDATFNGSGKVTTAMGSGNDEATSVRIQPNGKILVGGRGENGSNYYDFALARYNADGTLDTSFSGDGKLFTTFGSGGDAINSLALGPDGKIVAAGYAYNGVNHDFAVARYNTDGSLDTSFGAGGKRLTGISAGDDFAQSVALQPDGKIVAVGRASVGSDWECALVRWNADGSLDSDFDFDGMYTYWGGTGNSGLDGVAVQPDGKIVAAGQAGKGPCVDFAVMRFLPCASGSVHEQVPVTVEEKVTLLANGALGLSYFPDMNMPVLQRSPTLQLIAAAGTQSYLLEGNDIQHLTSAVQVLGAGSAGSFDNGGAWIGSVYRHTDGKLYAFYHAEDQENMPPIGGGIPGFYASIAVAVSIDDGRHFTKLGQVITSFLPKNPDGSPAQGAGECSVFPDRTGRYLYAYYTDHSDIDGRGVQICMARADLTQGAPTAGVWQKYYQGGFTEPGLGGRETPVVSAPAGLGHAINPDVSYSARLGKYVMAWSVNDYFEYSLPSPLDSGIYLSYSDDGVHWSSRQQIVAAWSIPLTDREVKIHPTIVWDDSDGASGKGWLVYGYSPRWGSSGSRVPHYMAGQRVTVGPPLLAYESFNYPLGTLQAQGGNGSFGFGANWMAPFGSTYASEDSLVFGSLLNAGNHAQVGVDSRLRRLLDTSTGGRFADYLEPRQVTEGGATSIKNLVGAAGQTLYVSFLQQASAANGYWAVEFQRADYTPQEGDFNRALFVGYNTAAYVVESSFNGVSRSLGAVDTSVNLIVMKFEFGDNNVDRVSVYRNPSLAAEPATPVATLTGDLAFDRITLASFVSSAVHRVDEIRFGTSYEAVVGAAVSDLAPTLDAIPDPAPILEDAGQQTIVLTGITAGGDEIQTLHVTANSGNATLISDPSVSYTSPGSTGTLTYIPLPDQYGAALITVTVRDPGRDGTFETADDRTFSRAFTANVTAFNDPPVIAALADGPDPLVAGQDLTLTASGVGDPHDPSGSVVAVSFYRESNGTAGLQVGGDILLGSDNSSADGWSTTIPTAGLAPGSYTYYACALDNEGGLSSDGTAAPSTTSTVEANCTLDADGNGVADPLSDGILILRYLLDPSGTWNDADALGAGATRTAQADIKNFLASGQATVLDADGNGTADALSDGILILRYLFDPAGPWRVDDAVAPNAARTTRGAIKEHLDQFNVAVTAVQWRVEDGGNGHYYELVLDDDSPKTWTMSRDEAAASQCLGMPGHLVTITSVAENDFLLNTFLSQVSGYPRFWIGAGDAQTEGTWQWVTGEPFSFQYWCPGEPNNSDGVEDYVLYWRGNSPQPWGWNDAPDSYDNNPFGYIVEYEPAQFTEADKGVGLVLEGSLTHFGEYQSQGDPLSDGILILRGLFDPTGAWNVADALGAGATRTTWEVVKAHLDGFNPALNPAPGLMAVGPAEELSSPVPPEGGSSQSQVALADQFQAAIAQAVLISTSTAEFASHDQNGIPEQVDQAVDVRAIDSAMQSWDRQPAYDARLSWIPVPSTFAPAADELWHDGDLDRFLTGAHAADDGQELGEVILSLP